MFDGFRQEIDVAAKDLCKSPPDSGQAEKADVRSRVKLGDEVDIARRVRLATRGRAEQRQATSPGATKLQLMAAQYRDDPVGGRFVIITFVFLAGLL